MSEDSPTRYCLEGGLHPKHKKPMPIAWVEVGKNYVSFHHMGVYCAPELLAGASKKLKARMQGFLRSPKRRGPRTHWWQLAKWMLLP